MRTDITLDFSPPVRHALDHQEPVVALESSVFAQGLPIPANANAARRMFGAVEERGVVPAITAISRGRPTIGLEGEDLKRFLCRDGVRKVSSRDLGAAMALRADGATTVAGTLVLARLANIHVFATGGIGGVHRRTRGELERNAQVRDESADLLELARSRLVVVCAGAKSILDLAATWERLETLGIPVIGYRTSELPGFFSAQTGIQLNVRCDTADEIAAIARSHWSLGNGESVLVVQAPPAEQAMPGSDVERAIAQALLDAERKGIEGPTLTPFLLEAVSRLTNGRSLDVNLALLENNAALAADIARSLAA
ncbi:MAG TPA: pseudouridine-5'-phosphate glycosidase [Gemmatimonadaceae bacterium]